MKLKTIGMGLFAALVVTATASATLLTDQVTHIASVRVAIGSPSVGVIEMTEDSAARPTCSTFSQGGGTVGRFLAIDLSSDGGRESLKLAQEALLAGKSVRIVGTGFCTISTAKENLSQIYMFQ